MRDRLIALNLAILAALGWTPPEPPEQRLKMCYLLEAHYKRDGDGRIYGDPEWKYRDKTVEPDMNIYYRLYTENRRAYDGVDPELPDGWRVHFLSNGEDHHGDSVLGAFVYELVPVDGVGG